MRLNTYVVDKSFASGRMEVSQGSEKYVIVTREEGLLAREENEFRMGESGELSGRVLGVLTGDREEFSEKDLLLTSQIICAVGVFRGLLKKSFKAGDELSEEELRTLSEVRAELSVLMMEIDPDSAGDVDVLQEQLTDAYREVHRRRLESDMFLDMEKGFAGEIDGLGRDEIVEQIITARDNIGMFSLN